MRLRLVAALSATVLSTAGLAVAAGVPAAANAARASGTVVGGPLLASKGLIVAPKAGAPALPPASALPASSWMVTNLTTGQVLAAKDPHGKFLPASTLKTLTAITLLPKLNPHAMEPVSLKDESVDGTRVGLVDTMKYTVAKLFTCMLVVSANDAADTLAQANGGIKKTVRQMNAKARQLQADDTFARTPSGLDGVGETTSAYDLALIGRAAFAMPQFRHYVQVVHSKVPAPHHKSFAIWTHNELLTSYRGDIGGKNGYTVAAQGTYVGAATRHGQTIMVTLMHANPDFWPMARSLLTWGFKANRKVTSVGSLVAPLSKTASPPPVAPTRVIGSKPLTQTATQTLPWSTIEVAIAAALVAITVFMVMQRRRRMRQRSYRPRLRLPPM